MQSSKRLQWGRAALVALGLVAAAGAATAADQRTWSDRTGRYKVEGKMVGFLNGVITLERPNGSRTTISLAKLSTADRNYVQKELAAAKETKPKGDAPGADPFEPAGGKPGTPKPSEGTLEGGPGMAAGSGRSKGGRPGAELGVGGELGAGGVAPGLTELGSPGAAPGGEGGPAKPAGGRPPAPPTEGAPLGESPSPAAAPGGDPGTAVGPGAGVAPDWVTDLGQAKVLGLGNVRDSFPLAISAGPKPSKPAGPDPLPLPKAPDFFDKVTGLAVSTPAGKAVVGMTTERPGSPDSFSRFYLCDLAGGSRPAETKVSGKYIPVSLSDDGRTLAVLAATGPFNKAEKLELWSVEGKFRRLAAFRPYDGLPDNDRDVKSALLVGRDRLVTTNTVGTLVVWDVATGSPLYQVPAQRDAAPAVSPDGKFVAFATDQDVGLLDVAAGKVVGQLPVKSLGRASLAFSPDGKRLAHGNFQTASVFDLASGKLEKSFAAPFVGVPDAAFFFADDDHVYSSNAVYSVKFGLPVWNYTGGEVAKSGGEYAYFVVSERDRAPGALVPVTMPPPRAVKQLEAASQEPDFLILKPGSAVKVDTSGIDDGLKQGQIRIALLERVEAAGYRVADDAKVVLKASSGFSKESEISYRSFGAPMFGGPFGRDNAKTYKVKPFFTNLAILYEGKSAWTTGSGGGPPPFIRLDQDETVDSYLRKLEVPDYAFFEKVTLPKSLTKPLGENSAVGLGMSKVTTAGAR